MICVTQQWISINTGEAENLTVAHSMRLDSIVVTIYYQKLLQSMLEGQGNWSLVCVKEGKKQQQSRFTHQQDTKFILRKVTAYPSYLSIPQLTLEGNVYSVRTVFSLRLFPPGKTCVDSRGRMTLSFLQIESSEIQD